MQSLVTLSIPVTLCVCVETEVAAPWTEETVRQCLFLYLSLLPLNHRLVHELASVYTEAIADIKRSVLRAIEQPVSHCLVSTFDTVQSLACFKLLWTF